MWLHTVSQVHSDPLADPPATKKDLKAADQEYTAATQDLDKAATEWQFSDVCIHTVEHIEAPIGTAGSEDTFKMLHQTPQLQLGYLCHAHVPACTPSSACKNS